MEKERIELPTSCVQSRRSTPKLLPLISTTQRFELWRSKSNALAGRPVNHSGTLSDRIPVPGIEPGPSRWKRDILTIGLYGKNVSAPAGNRTLVSSMATKNYTTKPLERWVASGGNRTPGRCLEGVYVTTTPLKPGVPPPRFERRSSDSKSDVITNYTMGEDEETPGCEMSLNRS